MKKSEKVIVRLKEILNIKTDKKLADFLSMTSLSNHKKRDTIPYEEIIEKASLGKYKLDYIFLGVGEQKHSSIGFNLDSEVERLDAVVKSKELAELLCDLIKYGNKDLYENIGEKLNKIKTISKQ